MKKDIFSENKKIAGLSKRIRETFDGWSYEEFFLPFIEEYADSFRGGLKYSDGKRFYLIKPDATSQIIERVKHPREYRYFYFTDYFLNDGSCSVQFGAEFIGENPLQQKIEILHVVASVLGSAEVKQFCVDIGSLTYLNGILSKIPEYRHEAMKAIEKRDFSPVEKMKIDEGVKEALWHVFCFRGKTSGIPQLDEILESLPEENFFVDTGTVRYLDYYEDIVFEIYTPSSGKALGGGGDYAVKGMTGFGFSMDLRSLAEVAGFQPVNDRERKDGEIKMIYAEAKNRVANGKKVEVVV